MIKISSSKTFFVFTSVLFTFCSLSFSYDFAGGTGEPNDPFQIETAEQLLQIGSDANLLDKCYILINDIDLDPNVTGIPPFIQAPIAPDINSIEFDFQGTAFTGIFNGNRHVIENLIVDILTDSDPNNNEADYLGLFGRIEAYGNVNNLGLENVNVVGGFESGGLGGLCGYNDLGNITNCYSTGDITTRNGSGVLGGLCGVNSGGNITNCYSAMNISAGSNNRYIGGLCGYSSFGLISNSYSIGSVTAGDDSGQIGGLVGINRNSTINYCYSVSFVTAGDNSEYLGGLCGIDYEGLGTFNNCYFLDTAGPDNGLGTPLTDTHMKQQESFVNWDFDDIWAICEGTNYPRLQWQILPADFLCPDGVDFIDYAHFSYYWLNVDCAGSNDCERADFDFSGCVDGNDLKTFTDFWLEE